MEQAETNEQTIANDIYQYAANLMVVEKKGALAVRKELVNKGLDEESARFVVNNLKEEINAVQRKRAIKDIVWGSVWCIGGLIGTFANTGFIFWGQLSLVVFN